MSARLNAVFLLLLGLVAGWIAGYEWAKPANIRSDEVQRLMGALDGSRRTGNQVASCRGFYGDDGRLLDPAKAGRWEVVLSGWTAPAAPASWRIVFVHGYNVSPAEAVDEGNRLCAQLRRSAGAAPGANFSFHTFCWRGDLGPEHFGAAEESAASAALALERFLMYLRRLSPVGGGARGGIVVITHSLGAKVALEALQERLLRGVPAGLAGLIMLQPAVAWSDIGVGPVTLVLRDEKIRLGGVVTYELRGRYYEALDKLPRLLATCSQADAVLGNLYLLRKRPWAPDTQHPDPYTALGTTVTAGQDGWKFPSGYAQLDLSPQGRSGLRIRGHSDLVGEDNQELANVIWGEVARDCGPALVASGGKRPDYGPDDLSAVAWRRGNRGGAAPR